MGIGRKPAHMVIQNGKSNRQRVWEMIRKHPEGISCYTLSRRTDLNDETVRTYVNSLRKAGYLKRGTGVGDRTEFLLVHDVGTEAPQLRLDGTPSQQGRGTEAMWRTLRMLDEVNATELAMYASTAAATSIATAKSYLKWLNWAGYLTVVTPAQPGKQARYCLSYGMYTGPIAPMIQRQGQVFDPNTGKVTVVRKLKESRR